MHIFLTAIAGPRRADTNQTCHISAATNEKNI